MILQQVAIDYKENGEINGGDDDVDDDSSVPVCPACREALQAASIVQRFIEGMDEPYAQKLEVILVSFGHATYLKESRSMHDTLISDFFGCR